MCEGGGEEWVVAPTISEVIQLLHWEEWVGAAAGLGADFPSMWALASPARGL